MPQAGVRRQPSLPRIAPAPTRPPPLTAARGLADEALATLARVPTLAGRDRAAAALDVAADLLARARVHALDARLWLVPKEREVEP